MSDMLEKVGWEIFMQYLRNNEMSIQQGKSLRTQVHLMTLKERMGKDG